jgi:hypothetical protein
LTPTWQPRSCSLQMLGRWYPCRLISDVLFILMWAIWMSPEHCRIFFFIYLIKRKFTSHLPLLKLFYNVNIRFNGAMRVCQDLGLGGGQ